MDISMKWKGASPACVLAVEQQQGGLLGCASPPGDCVAGSRAGERCRCRCRCRQAGNWPEPRRWGRHSPAARGVLLVLANKENQLRYTETCRAWEGKSVCILANREILSVKWTGRSWLLACSRYLPHTSYFPLSILHPCAFCSGQGLVSTLPLLHPCRLPPPASHPPRQ